MFRRFAAIGLLAMGGCADHDLRGRSTPSPDGQTYLVIADHNGGACGPIRVDGAIWPHAINTPGPVSAGKHTVSCGTEVSIRVDSAKTFRMDYWGP